MSQMHYFCLLDGMEVRTFSTPPQRPLERQVQRPLGWGEALRSLEAALECSASTKEGSEVSGGTSTPTPSRLRGWCNVLMVPGTG